MKRPMTLEDLLKAGGMRMGIGTTPPPAPTVGPPLPTLSPPPTPKASPVLTGLTAQPASDVVPMTPMDIPATLPPPMASPLGTQPRGEDKTPKGPKVPEPMDEPVSPPPPTRGPQPAPAVPPPPPPPAEPAAPPVEEGTTGPRKGPKIPEPEPEQPTQPAPPDRSRPTGGGTTNTPPNPVTTPSPPVAPPAAPREATPRDESEPAPRTAKPKKGRWNVQSFLRALQQPGGYGAAFAGGDELAELTAYLDQQRQLEAARSQRLQTLLQGRQIQPRVARPRASSR